VKDGRQLMNRTRRIATNLSYLFLGEGISVLLAFVTTIWLARQLTDEGFGRLAYVQSIIAYFAILTDLGLSVFGTREIARQPELARKISANIFAIRLSIAAGSVVLLSLVVSMLSLNLEMKLLLLAGSLALLTQAMNPEFLFQGLERMGGIALWRILIHGLYLLPIILLVKSREQLVWVPVFRFAAECIAVFICLAVIWRLLPGSWRRSLDVSAWPSFVQESVVIALAVLVVRVYYSFDTLMLGAMDRPEAVGWYSAALKIAQLLMIAATLIQSSFAPFIAKEAAKPEQLDRVMLRFGILLTAIGGLASGTFILLNGFIVTTLYGAAYLNAGAPLLILCISTLVNYMATAFTAALIFGGRQKAYLKIVIAATLVNVVLNLLLIPKFSYMGAAWSNLGFNVALLGLSLPAYFKIGRSAMVLRHPLLICLLTAVLVLALSHVAIHPFLRSLIFIFSFGGAMMLMYKTHVIAFVQNWRQQAHPQA